MAKEEEVTKFISIVATCTEHDINALLRNPSWGEVNFEEGKDCVENLFEILNQFKIYSAEIIPSSILTQFTSKLTQINQTLSEMVAFDIKKDNPLPRRNEILGRLKNSFDDFFISAHIYIPYLAFRKGDVEKNINNLSLFIEKSKTETEKNMGIITSNIDEMSKIISAAREASAKAGVGHFTHDFADVAVTYEEKSKYWLKLTAKLGVTTLIVAIVVSLYGIFGEISPDKQIQYISSKILLIIILGTATLWCGRLYKSCQHLYTVNKHRENALKTFQAFIQATDDEPTKNAVLLETTRSIFTIISSGFIDSHESSGSDSNFKFLEIVKNIGNQK